MLFLFMQDGQNVCHIVAATHSADAVGVAELLTKTNCPLDAVDVNVRFSFLHCILWHEHNYSNLCSFIQLARGL